MIDITVDDKENKIEVEYVTYHFRTQQEMINLLCQLIHKLKYSGEGICLYRAEGDMKVVVEEW